MAMLHPRLPQNAVRRADMDLSGNTTLSRTAHNGKRLWATAALTLTVPAAATLGPHFDVEIVAHRVTVTFAWPDADTRVMGSAANQTSDRARIFTASGRLVMEKNVSLDIQA